MIIASPARAGIHHPKRQLFVDTFEIPKPPVKSSRKAKKPKTNRQPTGKLTTKPAAKQPKKQASDVPDKKATRKTARPEYHYSGKDTAETKTKARREYERTRNKKPERMEYHRLYQKERSQQAKALGLCKHCGNPAIPGQTRCESCAEKHRVSRRRSDAIRMAMTKQTATTITNGLA